MGFLDVLGKQLESQFGIGEVQDHSINAKIDGKDVLYGRLGNYASQFDHTAERSYVDQGFIRPNAYQMDLNTLDVLMQEPNATVLIKKRMFSSLAENYNLSTMDKDEKLFYRASQILFNNKCKQISALEKLSKIEAITRSASITEQFLPAIFNLTESVADATFSLGGEQSDTGIYKFIATIDKIRKNYAFNKTAKTTTWLQDSTTYLKNGDGTGVMEITTFSNFNTNVGLNLGDGGCTVNIEDPYKSMLITEFDIEKAISDATNSFYNKKLFQFSRKNIDELIDLNTRRLNTFRNNRNVSPLTIKVNPDSIFGKRVRVIVDNSGIEIPFEFSSGNFSSSLGLGSSNRKS